MTARSAFIYVTNIRYVTEEVVSTEPSHFAPHTRFCYEVYFATINRIIWMDSYSLQNVFTGTYCSYARAILGKD